MMLDDERKTFPPGSRHRNPIKWDHVAVWSGMSLTALATAYGLYRLAMFLVHLISHHRPVLG